MNERSDVSQACSNPPTGPPPVRCGWASGQLRESISAEESFDKLDRPWTANENDIPSKDASLGKGKFPWNAKIPNGRLVAPTKQYNTGPVDPGPVSRPGWYLNEGSVEGVACPNSSRGFPPVSRVLSGLSSGHSLQRIDPSLFPHGVPGQLRLK